MEKISVAVGVLCLVAGLALFARRRWRTELWLPLFSIGVGLTATSKLFASPYDQVGQFVGMAIAAMGLLIGVKRGALKKNAN